MIRRPPLQIAAAGMGLNTTAMLLMSAHGVLPPLDAAIFSNTHAETDALIQHLRWMQSGNALPFPLIEVSYGDLREELLAAAEGFLTRASNPPFYSMTDGIKGQLRRSCTRDYKIYPVQKAARKLHEELRGKIYPGCIELWIGICSEEAVRYSERSPKYITLRYPFLERATRPVGGTGLWFSRRDCEQWLRDHEYDVPIKSACTFCPFRSNQRWRELRDKDPAGWQDAVRVDAAIRNGLPGTTADALYVHRDCVPLSDANIEVKDAGDDLFNQDCEGGCGI
jgi:hypothetical protein